MRFPSVAAALLLASSLIPALAPAKNAASSDSMTAEQFEASLGYTTGTVVLKDGVATINVPKNFRFIGPPGSRRLLTEAWGNPPDAAESVLGMLIPADTSPVEEGGWGVVITFDEDGYVDDKEAAGLDYNKLMKDMKAGNEAANAERVKEGYDALTLVGWAEPPSYDAATHKLYWAKELSSSRSKEHTLNYAIRILGRRGVLQLNAVSGMKQLAEIRPQAKALISSVSFNEGHRYADYVPGKDKAATYGIVGLIAGATLMKSGLLKVIIAGAIAFKKVIVIGVIALFASIKKLFGGGKGNSSGNVA